MAGFLSGIGDLLKNPAVMELLPAALGAAGGALSSPRLAGGRGALGRGLLGGSEGLMMGQQAAAQAQLAPAQMAELQQHTAYLTQQTKQMQQAATNDQVWSANYGKWVDQLPADKQPDARIFGQSTDPKDRLKAVQMIKDEMARPVSEKFLSKLHPGVDPTVWAGLPTETLHDLMGKSITGLQANRKFEIKNTEPDQPPPVLRAAMQSRLGDCANRKVPKTPRMSASPNVARISGFSTAFAAKLLIEFIATTPPGDARTNPDPRVSVRGAPSLPLAPVRRESPSPCGVQATLSRLHARPSRPPAACVPTSLTCLFRDRRNRRRNPGK
jgi:hypothetical protein